MQKFVQSGRRARLGSMFVTLGVMLAMVVSPIPAQADASGRGGDYVPIDSIALLDTRDGTGGTTGVRGAKSVTTFNAVGIGGIPASGVSALMVDVTAIYPTANTFLTIYPDLTDPKASAMNASIGEVMTNSAVVKPGTNGKLAVRNAGGNVHIRVDVVGYFTTATGSVGSGFVPVNHTRVVDSRTGQGITAGTMPTSGTRTANISGGGLVPTSATAVMLDVVVIGATGNGWMTVGSSAVAETGIDYAKGVTSMGMVVKLNPGGGGSVILENRGSAVHVAITVQGYWTGSPTTGAGLRPIAATTLYDSRFPSGAPPVPANGSIDVAVGGTNGLPIRGIAAAVLNVHAVSPTVAGFLTVTPLDGTTNTVSTANFPAPHVARSSLVVTKLGTEGKVRIKNASSGTVHIVVDLQGWFADPLPFLPIESFSRTVVMQSAPAQGAQLGGVVYAYTDNGGQVRIINQYNPDDFSFNNIKHIPMFGMEAFTGRPTLNLLAGTGQMQINALHINGGVWNDTQTAPNADIWSSKEADEQLSGPLAVPPVAVTLANGISVIFGVDADGRLWHYRQTGTDASWRSLGLANIVGGLTAVKLDAATGARLVATSSTGTIKTAVYSADGILSAWTDLGGNVTGLPGAFVGQGWRTGVVARAADGSVVMKKQNFDLSWPSAWQTVGTFVSAGSPTAIVDPVLGRIVVAARGPDNEMYRVYEAEQESGTWGEWRRLVIDTDIPPRDTTGVTDPVIAPVQTSSGPGFVTVYRNRNGSTTAVTRELEGSAASAAKAGPSAVSFDAHVLTAPPA
ncbi:hypothetical protein [Micromonospora sp. DH14]|uniref:hypothetical protein n=1 Tax=Micromonospora sp. DH14 TaxID=3040120 RepID=UPI002441F6B5|nr:hypothetical protein [Micromonospora sp. DH14]MDG9678128.1 hypothetical protein [Micromonospora sp. DH14]